MYQKEAIEKLAGEILDGTDLQLKVDAYSLEENLETGDVKVHCEVHHERTGEKNIIEGHGVGIVDATFHGLVALYSGDFPSLNTIRFADFSVKADLESAHEDARTDMTAAVTLRVANSEGREYLFTHASRSITQSSIAVTLEAAEFFLNAERAFIMVYKALRHAREKNRADSIERYTGQLVTLVEATSYSEVIEQIRRSEPELNHHS